MLDGYYNLFATPVFLRSIMELLGNSLANRTLLPIILGYLCGLSPHRLLPLKKVTSQLPNLPPELRYI